MTVTSPHWARLADLLTERRVRLGYSSRRKFAEQTGMPYRILSDLETSRRQNFSRETKIRVEDAYGWRRGSLDAVLAGNEPNEVASPVLQTWLDSHELARQRTDEDLRVDELLSIDDGLSILSVGYERADEETRRRLIRIALDVLRDTRHTPDAGS